MKSLHVGSQILYSGDVPMLPSIIRKMDSAQKNFQPIQWFVFLENPVNGAAQIVGRQR
jgi:hypothetical protein